MNCPRCQSKTMVIRTIQFPAKTIRIRLCPCCSCEFSTVEIPDPNQHFSDKLPGQTS